MAKVPEYAPAGQHPAGPDGPLVGATEILLRNGQASKRGRMQGGVGRRQETLADQVFGNQ